MAGSSPAMTETVISDQFQFIPVYCRNRRALMIVTIVHFLIIGKTYSLATRHRGVARIASTIAMVSTLTRATRLSRSTTFSL